MANFDRAIADGAFRTRRSGPILVVSAFAPELRPLRSAPARRGGRDGAIVYLPVGIGAVDAAAGTARALAHLEPRMLLFVGTAGTYGRQPAVGGVAIARSIWLASTAVARGEGYLPRPMVAHTSSDPALRTALRRNAGAGAVLADVATPLAITKTMALGRLLSATTGCDVENLEAFAVARAADAVRVPFAVVLGISNRVGPRAHAEWRQHQRRAVAAASAVIKKYLDSILESSPTKTAARVAASSITAPSRSAPPRRRRSG